MAEWPWPHQNFNKKGMCLFFFYPILWSLSILGCRNRAVEMASAGIKQLISSLLEDFWKLQTCLVLLEDFQETPDMFGSSFIIPKRSFGKQMQFGSLSSIVGQQNGHFFKSFFWCCFLYMSKQLYQLIIQYIHSTVNIIAISSI